MKATNFTVSTLATLLLLLTTSAQASQEITPASTEEASQHNESANSSAVNEEDAVEPFESSSEQIQNLYDEWLDKASNKARESCKRRNIDLSDIRCRLDEMVYFGDATVHATIHDRQWYQARQLAYDEALMKAFSEVAQAVSLNHEVKILQNLTQDNTPIEDDPFKAKDQVNSLLKKAVALSNGILDKKLEDLGIDPHQYDSLPPSKKKNLLENSISNIAHTKAIADTTGLTPLQTFTGFDGNTTKVRCVVVKNADRIGLVKAMLKDGASIPPNPAKKAKKSLRELFSDKKALASQFGVRLVYDQEGYPSLVAFGQSGVWTSDKAAFANHEDLARSEAKTNALNSLTLLLNASTKYEKWEQKKASYEENLTQTQNSDSSVDTVKSSDNLYQSKSRESSEAKGQIKNFAGVRQLKSWSMKDPATQKYIVGSVLIWTPKQAKYQSDLKNIKATDFSKESSLEEKKKIQKSTPTPGASQGMETDDYEF